MFPALPTGRQCTSGASPRSSTISKAARLLALQPVRVHRVDQGHRVLGGQLPGQFQAVVERAVHLEQPGPVHQRLGELADGDLAPRHQHRAGEPGPRRVGGGAGAGVAGRRADDRLGAAPAAMLIATVMPRSLNDPVGFPPSTLRYTSQPVRADRTGAGSSGVPPSRRVITGVASVTGSQSRYSSITPRHVPSRACCCAGAVTSSSPSTRITLADRADDRQGLQFADGRGERRVPGRVGHDHELRLAHPGWPGAPSRSRRRAARTPRRPGPARRAGRPRRARRGSG